MKTLYLLAILILITVSEAKGYDSLSVKSPITQEITANLTDPIDDMITYEIVYELATDRELREYYKYIESWEWAEILRKPFFIYDEMREGKDGKLYLPRYK
ncbi:MAG: hypothetical protein ACOYN6_10125 [Ignavibacteria bacterium]